MDLLQKHFYGVFELPLRRNAQKRTKKKSQEKKSRMVGGWVWDLANVRGGSVDFIFAGPSPVAAAAEQTGGRRSSGGRMDGGDGTGGGGRVGGVGTDMGSATDLAAANASWRREPPIAPC
jgi:hypothetical protein